MAKYLLSPAFEFTNKFLINIQDRTKLGDYRVLIYPVANGLRLRTMDMTMHAIIEVQGKSVYVDYEETVRVKEMNVPYSKRVMFCITSVSEIADHIDAFFEKTWTIEKDTPTQEETTNAE